MGLLDRRLVIALFMVNASACGGRITDGGNQLLSSSNGGVDASTMATASDGSTPPAAAGSSGSVTTPGASGTAAGGTTGSGGSGVPIDAGPTTGGSAGSGGGFDLRNYTLARTTLDGHLIGARWTGTVEAVDLIDPVTSTSALVGTLGDLRTWSHGIVYDASERVVRAVGLDADNLPHLYSLSFDTGVSGSVPLAHEYAAGGTTADGRFIGAYWTGTEEDVDLIDPATGDATFAGVLGDLTMWSGALIYDAASRTVLAIGENQNTGPYNVYSLSLDSGTSTQAPVERSYWIAGLGADGRMIAAFWDGAREPAVLLDPSSGLATSPAGFFGDLYWWQGQLAYDADVHAVYAIGQDAADVSHLYKVDLSP